MSSGKRSREEADDGNDRNKLQRGVGPGGEEETEVLTASQLLPPGYNPGRMDVDRIPFTPDAYDAPIGPQPIVGGADINRIMAEQAARRSGKKAKRYGGFGGYGMNPMMMMGFGRRTARNPFGLPKRRIFAPRSPKQIAQGQKIGEVARRAWALAEANGNYNRAAKKGRPTRADWIAAAKEVGVYKGGARKRRRY